MKEYLPEGRLLNTPENRSMLASPAGLLKAMTEGRVLEGMAVLCDADHNLRVDCGGLTGIIPRVEAARGIADGSTREIAILSRVGKPVSFVVESLEGWDGHWVPILSRRKAQEQSLAGLLRRQTGDIIPATVTHLEPFGAFVDIGCGIPSMISVERISISRIPHPMHRFTVGQHIYTLITGVDPDMGRLTLSHRELLGTWAENAAGFQLGATVPGVVRSIKDYGIFVELAPNLSGLAEPQPELQEGDRISVYIKSIAPERMKIKLIVIDKLPPLTVPAPLRYYATSGRLSQWRYAPEGCGRGAVFFSQTA